MNGIHKPEHLVWFHHLLSALSSESVSNGVNKEMNEHAFIKFIADSFRLLQQKTDPQKKSIPMSNILHNASQLEHGN
jgi:hypothetical protein